MHSAYVGLVGLLVWLPAAGNVLGQDASGLRINEVIANNVTQGPLDIGGSRPDLLELYNAGGETITLGTNDPDTSFALTDTLELPAPGDRNHTVYTFRPGVAILGQGFLTIFCDADAAENYCEPHASFRISNDGEEPLTLWGPVIGTEDGKPVREIIDQVWLPPLSEDVSFGRKPDGAGPAPVPLEDVLSTFVFFPPGETSFGSCAGTPGGPVTCPGGQAKICLGDPNLTPDNLRPRVNFEGASTNRPRAGESVEIRVRVEDEMLPLLELTPGASIHDFIASAQLVYRVNGGAEQGPVELVYDETLGVQHEIVVERDLTGVEIDRFESPFAVWTEWTGTIPGQPAGSRVEFYLKCTDAEGAVDETPLNRCPDTMGPCDQQFGGPNCPRAGTEAEPDTYYCDVDVPDGEGGWQKVTKAFFNVRYIPCDAWYTYAVGYEPPERLLPLVINEVVASQTKLRQDTTDDACALDNPTCKYDDFVELFNGGDEAIDLSGLWLSDNRFNPENWAFPTGASIAPGEYLIVWLDGDGGKCPCDWETVAPEDSRYCGEFTDKPCFWDCYDPTDVAIGEYHTNFQIDATSDQLYIYDTRANGYGVIHAAEWTRAVHEIDQLATDHSLALVPDGVREGCWVVTGDHGSTPGTGETHPIDGHTHLTAPTPGEPNEFFPEMCPALLAKKFIRGDANADCALDITDGIFVLNYLFLGGGTPTCLDAADTNDSGEIDITDGIFMLNYLFLGGNPPPDPGPSGIRGEDPTPDDLTTCEFPEC